VWPVLSFAVGGQTYGIPTYALALAVGLVVLILGLDFEGTRQRFEETAMTRFMLAVVGSLVIGWTGSILATWGLERAARPTGAVSALPGILVGAAFLGLAMRGLKIPIAIFRAALPYACVAHGCGRVGCFLAGCCFGAPTDAAVGVAFPPGSLPFRQFGHVVRVHPVALRSGAARAHRGRIVEDSAWAPA
jgi:phosphatidylglycerol:prolipoprotein diacylglycerol transferase